ncbi:hypothetical protein DPMN_125027 [Dreissena polymorpha]|uniref:Uncharacterized protein n=1 Tax=Dreissena polymorpha TaxID=45954 RepID=A0A9D4GWR1_DREPO|nr:hypothetical protein DPMN_125027 [Dreissena polymorpha]
MLPTIAKTSSSLWPGRGLLSPPSLTENYKAHGEFMSHLQDKCLFVETCPTLSYRWTERARRFLC